MWKLDQIKYGAHTVKEIGSNQKPNQIVPKKKLIGIFYQIPIPQIKRWNGLGLGYICLLACCDGNHGIFFYILFEFLLPIGTRTI